LDSYQKTFELLDKKLADAGIVSRLFGNKYEKSFNVTRSTIIFSPTELRFGFPKNAPLNDKLISTIDKHLNILKKESNSPYYRSIEGHIKGEKENISIVIPQFMIIILYSIIGLLIVFLLFIILLRNLVRKKTCALKEANKKLEEEFVTLKEFKDHLKKEELLRINLEKDTYYHPYSRNGYKREIKKKGYLNPFIQQKSRGKVQDWGYLWYMELLRAMMVL